MMPEKIKTYPLHINYICHEGTLQLCSAVVMQAIKDNYKEFFDLKDNIYLDYLDISEGTIDAEVAYINWLKSKAARKPNKAIEIVKHQASILQKKIMLELKDNVPICEIAKKMNMSQQRIYYYKKKIEREEMHGTN